jgi:hypothetical protein
MTPVTDSKDVGSCVPVTRNRPTPIIEIFQTAIPLLLEQNVHQVRDTFLDPQARIRSPNSVRAHPGAINTVAREVAELRAV